MACKPFNDTIKVDRLARAYVPMQKLCTLLEPTQALLSGTIFPELVSFYK
ncbi:MAG: spore coat associated protein CotJA [Firmicutes bacterium]|nr:spore coat associated protein CotJA [Bacillota bacterium]MBQ9604516.1 spore coat associated protein CotJA [Bacillota bacterium]